MSPASGQTRAESPALFGHHRTHPRCCACLRHSSRCRDSRDLYCSGGRRRQSWRGPSPDEHCSTAGDECRDAALGRLLVSPCGSDADGRSRPGAAGEKCYRTHHDSRASFGPGRLDVPARGNHRFCRAFFLPGHCVSSEAWGQEALPQVAVGGGHRGDAGEAELVDEAILQGAVDAESLPGPRLWSAMSRALTSSLTAARSSPSALARSKPCGSPGTGRPCPSS